MLRCLYGIERGRGYTPLHALSSRASSACFKFRQGNIESKTLDTTYLGVGSDASLSSAGARVGMLGRLRRVDLDEHAARLVGVANEAHGFFRGHSFSGWQQEIKRVVRVLQVRMLYVGRL